MILRRVRGAGKAIVSLFFGRTRRPAAAVLLFGFLAALNGAPDTLRQPLGGENAEPAYKVFYENGFYREAIDLLRMRIRERPDTVDVDYLTYLAFCYAAGGWRDSAISVFREIVTFDSTFKLDTIATSPKILEVFTEAAPLRRARSVPAVPSPVPDTVAGSLFQKPAPPSSRLTFPVRPAEEEKPVPPYAGWDRYGFYCLPGGAGQFYRGRQVRGAVMLALQVAGLTAGLWAYEKRQSIYDSDYGLWEGNKRPYEKYWACGIGGFSIFLSTYSISVIENFINGRNYHPRQK